MIGRGDVHETVGNVLSQADKVLATVDESFILTNRAHNVRPLPTFRYDEIALGKVLGTGGFGIVYEISKLSNYHNNNLPTCVPPTRPDDQNDPPSINIIQQPQQHKNEFEDRNRNQKQYYEAASSMRSISSEEVYSDINSHIHYKVHKAKDWMEKCCSVTCSDLLSSRYALKRLQIGLTTIERARGMLDLAIEAKYLSIIWHPNIIKIRGIAEGAPLNEGFFIIIDRLCETLDARMDVWREEMKKHHKLSSLMFGSSNKNKKLLLEQLLVDRLTVAYDLAAAFWYLHDHKLVYRDIKPANIGFDHRGMFSRVFSHNAPSCYIFSQSPFVKPEGDVKVFDFGLCKSLSSSLKAHDGEYGYRLTGQAGSLPYMAPEVVLCKTYDSTCDVFSFAILLWEILSLQHCCKGYTPEKFVDRVTIHRVRFPIKKSWPPLTRSMIPEAWDNDPKNRPNMGRVATLIRRDLNNMSSDDAILHRTTHLNNRSNHGYQYNVNHSLLVPP